MNTIDMDNEFGKLRAFMQAHDPIHGESFLQWLLQVEAHNPEQYHTQWVPYLADFSHHWRTSLLTVDTVEQLEEAARVAPFALFTFDGTAWTALARHARQQGKQPPTSFPPGFLFAHGFNDDKMVELVESEALQRVVHLNLVWGELTPHGIQLLAQCPSLSALKKLELRYHYDIKNEGVEALIASPFITNLEYLDLSQTHADAQGFCALTRSDFSKHLRELHFWNDVDSASIAQDFHTSTTLTQLTHLSLANTTSQDIAEILTSPNASTLRSFEFNRVDEMTTQHIQHISQSDFVSNLEALRLTDFQLSDAHIDALSQSQTFKALHTLDLSNNQLTSKGIQSLSRAPWLQNITSLNLSENPLDATAFNHLNQAPFTPEKLVIRQDFDQPNMDIDDGLAQWLATPHSARLKHLDLDQNHLSKSIHALAQAHHITGLTHLRLRNEDVELSSILALINSPVSQALETLDLSFAWEDDPERTNAVCRAFQNTPYLQHLTHLDLAHLPMEDETLKLLTQAPQCSGLTYLNIDGQQFSDDAIQAFVSSPHFANLTTLKIELEYAYPDEPLPKQVQMICNAPFLAQNIRRQFDPKSRLDEEF